MTRGDAPIPGAARGAVPEVRRGAARVAPTSPHATPPDPAAPAAKKSGPERFWDARRVRIALGACFVLSAGMHYAVSPWTMFPRSSLEVHDLDGELTIPIDLLEAPATPPPPPPPPPAAATPTPSPPPNATGTAIADAGAPRPHRDAGAPPDAGPPSDAGAIRDAGTADARAVASANDAGAPPGNLEGVSGPKLVTVAINVDVIRTNPVGAQLGPLLRGIPQWDEFMAGTDVDPVRDIDWIYIFGPGLIHTEKDAVLIRYNMADARAAKNIELLSHKDVNGGAWDSGVPGVKAWRGHADRAWRVFMLPRPHVAAMVPPDFAPVAARAFSRVEPHVELRPGEAVRFTVANASHALPWQLPPTLGELRMWVVPRPDAGADAWAEIDAPDDATADAAAHRLKDVAREQNSLAVKLVTRGVLDDFDATSEGKLVKVHLPASEDQLAALYDLIAAYLGVNTPPIGSVIAPPQGAASPPGAPGRKPR
jgi:hypothetical protein